MIKQLFIFFVICTATIRLYAQELPKVKVEDMRSGSKVPFDETITKRKLTLISFWATWCVPGKREVRTITSMMAGWKKQFDLNYIAVAVDQQHNEETARRFARSQKWNFPVYMDAQSALKPLLRFHALPYIMIIDRNGKVVFSHTGYLSAEAISEELKRSSLSSPHRRN